MREARGPSGRVIILYCDGAAKGNPGPAGAGVVIKDERGHICDERSKFLGHMTNNQAEYAALLIGLEAVEAMKPPPDIVHIQLDSELVARQLSGRYSVRSVKLRPYYEDTMRRLRRLKSYTITRIPREENREADLLAEIAINRHV